MKIETSSTFDTEKVCRVRIEIFNSHHNFYDEELIYKNSASKDAIYNLCAGFTSRINELRGLKFDLQTKVTVISLPHGQQVLTTEDDSELISLKTLFVMYANQMIHA
jgi:hypothetical protein